MFNFNFLILCVVGGPHRLDIKDHVHHDVSRAVIEEQLWVIGSVTHLLIRGLVV